MISVTLSLPETLTPDTGRHSGSARSLDKSCHVAFLQLDLLFSHRRSGPSACPAELNCTVNQHEASPDVESSGPAQGDSVLFCGVPREALRPENRCSFWSTPWCEWVRRDQIHFVVPVFNSQPTVWEYESLYKSHIWIPSSQCSPTNDLECDVTDDITATVPYNFRIRAMLGSQTSAWSTLEHPFNRNSTVLTPPRMEVTEHGLHLVIKLEDLGPLFEFLVVYSRKEPEAMHFKVVKSGGSPLHLGTMEPGAMYCVKAQARVNAIGRHSAFSQTQCVKMQGESLPLALAVVAFVGFMLVLMVVLLSIWKMGQLLQYSCCPSVVLPDTLNITSSSRKLISCRQEEVDTCAVAPLSSEHLFGVWLLQHCK